MLGTTVNRPQRPPYQTPPFDPRPRQPGVPQTPGLPQSPVFPRNPTLPQAPAGQQWMSPIGQTPNSLPNPLGRRPTTPSFPSPAQTMNQMPGRPGVISEVQWQSRPAAPPASPVPAPQLPQRPLPPPNANLPPQWPQTPAAPGTYNLMPGSQIQAYGRGGNFTPAPAGVPQIQAFGAQPQPSTVTYPLQSDINPQPVFSDQQTRSAMNQRWNEGVQNAFTAQRDGGLEGMGFASPALQATRAVDSMQALNQGAQGAQEISLADRIANSKNMMAGQMARGDDWLSQLRNLGGFDRANQGYGAGSRNMILQALLGGYGGLDSLGQLDWSL